MKDIQKGDVVFQCDGCGEALNTESSNWDTAMNVLRRNGWKARKSGEDWKHFCPGCQRCP